MFIHQTGYPQPQDMETPVLETEKNEAPSTNQESPKGLTLDQVFDSDILVDASVGLLPFNEELGEQTTPGFLNKFFSWWIPPNLKTEKVSHPPDISLVDSTESDTKPLSPIPELDPPSALPPDLATAIFPSPPKKVELGSKLTDGEIVNGLSCMNAITMEAILMAILNAEFELEKQNAETIEGTLSKYHAFKKLHDQLFQEIKEALAKDEKLSKFFKTSQNIAVAAHFISGLAAIAANANNRFKVTIDAMLGNHEFIKAAYHTFIGAASFVAGAGVLVPAALTALTTGAKAYFDRRFKEDQAVHEQFNHQEKHYHDSTEAARQHLMSIANADNIFKERFIELLKRNRKMSRLIFAESD